MIGYIRSALASRFDHPVLALMYMFGGSLALLGGVFRWVTQPILNAPHPMFAAFTGVYAIFFATIATVGYLIIYAVRTVSSARDRMGPAA